MANFNAQFDYENCSDTELKAWVRQAIPIVISFVKASQKLLGKDKSLKNNSCASCSKRNDGCTTLCDDVKALLSGEFEGSSDLNNTYGDLIQEISKDADRPQQTNRSFLRAIDRVRSDEIFMLYKNCLQLFSKIEWRVITLRVQQDLTYKQIGENLNIKPRTACDAFQRSKRRMEEHYKKSRGLNRDT